MVIQDGTFAAACYNDNSIAELEDALLSPADKTDMAAWNLSESDYFAEIELALTAKRRAF